jgi:hypothetical protein
MAGDKVREVLAGVREMEVRVTVVAGRSARRGCSRGVVACLINTKRTRWLLYFL